jgi:hypothetical protein
MQRQMPWMYQHCKMDLLMTGPLPVPHTAYVASKCLTSVCVFVDGLCIPWVLAPAVGDVQATPIPAQQQQQHQQHQQQQQKKLGS